MRQTATGKWKRKLRDADQLQLMTIPQATQVPSSQFLTLCRDPSSHPRALRRDPITFLLLTQTDCKSATGNPVPFPNAKGIFPLRRFSLIPAPRPIAINPLSIILTPSAAICTWEGTQHAITKLTHDLDCFVAPPLSQHSRRALNTVLFARVTDMLPLQMESQNGPPRDQLHKKDLHAQGPTKSDSKQATFNFSPHLKDSPLLALQSFSLSYNSEAHPIELIENPEITSPEMDAVPSAKTTLPLELQPHMPTSEPPSPALPQLTPHPTQKGKRKAMPMRRSLRLQRKSTTTPAMAKTPTKRKNQKINTPFNLQSHEVPLDASAMISILQASGLNVNQTIQDMI